MRTPADISRSRTLTWTLFGIAALFALISSFAASGALGGSNSSPRAGLFPAVATLAKQPGIDSALAQVSTTTKSQGAAAALAVAQASGLAVQRGLVRVIVEARSGDTAAASAAVKAVGGTIDGSYANLVEALVPPAALSTLATDPAVAYVRPPLPHAADVV